MRVILIILATILGVLGVAFFASARSAIHQIEGFLCLVIAAVLFGSAAVIDAIKQRKRDQSTVENSLAEILSKLGAQSAHLKTLADTATRRPDLPPLPDRERYYLAIDGVAGDPHTKEETTHFLRKRPVDTNAYVLREGDAAWVPAIEWLAQQAPTK